MVPIRPPTGLIGMFHGRLADGVAEPKKPSVACRSWERSFCLRRWSASVSRSISRGFFSHSVHPFRAISAPAVAPVVRRLAGAGIAPESWWSVVSSRKNCRGVGKGAQGTTAGEHEGRSKPMLHISRPRTYRT